MSTASASSPPDVGKEAGEAKKSFHSGLQNNDNRFPSFLGSTKLYQARNPAQDINHDRIPSLMELCLLLEEQMFEFQLWRPRDKKRFGSHRWQIDPTTQAAVYARRRRLLLDIALFAYDFNESLVINDRNRAHSLCEILVDCSTSLDLSGIVPVPICQLVCSYLTQDFDYVRRDTANGDRQSLMEEEMEEIPSDIQRMLLENQRKIGCKKTDMTCIRDHSITPGLFWDFQRHSTGLAKVLGEKRIGRVTHDFHAFEFNPELYLDLSLIPTPLIHNFEETGDQFICLNVLVAAKGDEMWMGIHSPKMTLTQWPRTPENAVYYYGGRRGSIKSSCKENQDVGGKPRSDGCWGNIQHKSDLSIFKAVHLPYYQPGDWVSFRIDTLNCSFDVWLNNELIVCNVDCSDIPMPWTFVSVVDANKDLLFIEQVTDINGGLCDGFVDGLFYRDECPPISIFNHPHSLGEEFYGSVDSESSS